MDCQYFAALNSRSPSSSTENSVQGEPVLRAIINSSPLGYKTLLGKIQFLTLRPELHYSAKLAVQNQPLFETQKPLFL